MCWVKSVVAQTAKRLLADHPTIDAELDHVTSAVTLTLGRQAIKLVPISP
jgi:hypothetical protein